MLSQGQRRVKLQLMSSRGAVSSQDAVPEPYNAVTQLTAFYLIAVNAATLRVCHRFRWHLGSHALQACPLLNDAEPHRLTLQC